MNDKIDILPIVEKYLDKSGMSATSFGVLAANDRSFVRRLRNGLDVRVSTVNRILAYIRENTPDNPDHDRDRAA